jgi:predicted ABC-type transport system involved in lysophospholipase L1 biosynthesis ATPase subunit
LPADQHVLQLHDARKMLRLPSKEELLVLSSVDLVVNPGESVAIVGRSGSGKSTLLRALGLFDPFDSGDHVLQGTDVRSAGDRKCSRLRASTIGFVFQDFRLLPNLSALRNVEYACMLAGTPRRTRRSDAEAALEQVGLGQRLRSTPDQLSGGEQQRVAIARALVKRPALVLADEPTGALDSATGEAVMNNFLQTVRDTSAGLVVVTHDPAVASKCDRVLCLQDGVLHEEMAPAVSSR